MKYRKYHFPPLSITHVAMYVLPSCINPHILLHTLPQPVDIMFSRPQHSTFIISTMYTPSFITITYKSYNIDTIQIAMKNDYHNSPLITHTSQTYHLFP